MLSRYGKLTALLAALLLLFAVLWPPRQGAAAPVGPAPAGSERSKPQEPTDDGVDGVPSESRQGAVNTPAGRVGAGSVLEGSFERATVPSLQASLDELVRWVASRQGVVGAAIVDVASGRLLAGHSETIPLNPASNVKLVTAAAALHHLGAGYRYSTGVYGRISQGRAERLVLRGHGDPSLDSARLWEMAESLVDMGLERVGAVEVDGSRFDDSFVPPAFEQQPDEWASFRAPVSAVALDRNAVTLNVMPADSGEDARVWVHPAGFVEVQGKIRTLARGTREEVRLTLVPSGQRLVARVAGHVPEGIGRLQYSRRIDDPTLFPGYVLREYLRKLGVKVDEEVRRGSSEEKRRLVYVVSPPLRELLDELGKESDNFYAEMIFKTLGAEVMGQPARSIDGATVVAEWLKAQQAFPRGSRIVNGSGLFDADRLSALTLVRVLRQGYEDTLTRSEFLSQLAIGGVDGTLRSRFKDRSTKGRVRAKTGTLAAVDALSGYVMAPEGRAPVAFSILVNGVKEHRGARSKVDAVVSALTRYVWR